MAERSDRPPAPRRGPRQVGRAPGGRGRPTAAAQSAPAPPPPGPTVPDDIDPLDLDPAVRSELRSLPRGLADRVAGHLLAADRFLDGEPERAYEQARAARSLAGRVPATREAAGVAAYRTGRYAEALTELRTYRRMTGDPRHLPLLADCERALGRPERALALVDEPDAGRLDPATRVELHIVAAGARRDMGQPDAALAILRGLALDGPEIHPWSVRLWYAYADTLLAAGQREEAVRWFFAVTAVDADEETDAEDRLAALDAPDPAAD